MAAKGEPSWKWRRAVLFVIIAYCMAMLSFLVGDEDTRLHETLATGHIMLLAALVLGYQGFATAQDIAAIMATKSGTPYAPPPPPTPPEQVAG
jgi:hypothetical protein